VLKGVKVLLAGNVRWSH